MSQEVVEEMSLLEAPEYIKNVEAYIFEACGWQDCGEPTVIVTLANYYVDRSSYLFWVQQNVNPQSLDRTPRTWTFELLSEYIKDDRYLRKWAKLVQREVFA